MKRAFTKAFLASALAVTAMTAACGSGDGMPAYANVTVSFDETIVVDQLRFEVLRDNSLIADPAVRPENAGGPLTTAITVTIIVPEAVEGRDISVRAVGLYQGAEVTSGRIDNIRPLPGRGVDVNIVLGHVLQTFTVDPTSVVLPLGATQQILASATFSDERNGDVSEQCEWVSSNTDIITVSMEAGSRGLAKAVGQGEAVISVSLQGQTIQVPVRVDARRIVTLEVVPELLNMALGNTAVLTATASYSDGDTENVSANPGAEWSSSNPGAVMVDSEGNVTTVNSGNAQITVRFGGLQAVVPVSVSVPVITEVVIEPKDTRIARGFTRQFFAYGIRTDGSRLNITSLVSFSIEPSDKATITTLGLVTGNQVGEVVITAVSPDGPVGTVTAEITDATLQRFSISPTTPTVPQGQPVTFVATGVYSDGTDSDITSLCTWTSSNTNVATVPAGSATYNTNPPSAVTGSTTVTATPPVGSVPGPVTTVLTVSSAVLKAITVAPSSSSIAKGQTATFTATGILTDDTTTDLTTVAVWQSTNTAAATMSGNIATAVNTGQTTIRASFGGFQGTATLTVTAAQLQSIAITPTPVSIIVGTNRAMTATGTYTDGTRTITTQVTWSIIGQMPAVAGETVATIGVADGIVVGSHAGTAQIQATLSGVTRTAPLTVVNTQLQTIDILPATPSVITGATVTLTARGSFDNGTQQDITTTCQWDSLDPTKASVNNAGSSKGIVTGIASPSARITATRNGVTGQRTVTISDAVVTSVTIDQAPGPRTLAAGATINLTATAHYNNGQDAPVTTTGVWSSSNTAAATVDNGATFGGRLNTATGITGNLSTNITVTFGGQTSPNYQVNVTPAALNTITVTPNPFSAAAGESGNLTAMGAYADGSSRNITNDVTWSIPAAASGIATISNAAGEKGRVTTVAQGSTVATATLGAVTGNADVNVNPATTVSVSVTCDAYTTPHGVALQCHALATLTNSTQTDITANPNVTWTIVPESVATGTVSAGLVTGSSQGILRVRCRRNTSGISGDSPDITITAPVVRSIAVTPGTASVAATGTQQFQADATYTDNNVVTNVSASWGSSDTNVATCDASGLCTTVNPGSTTITATFGGRSGTAELTCTP